MLRALHGMLAEHRLDGLVPLKPALERARRRIEASLPGDAPFAPMTTALAARVNERFAASNASFVRDYFGGRHAELFAPPGGLAPSTWSFAAASEAELRVFARVVESALAELREGVPEDAHRDVAGAAGRRLGRRLRLVRRLDPRRRSSRVARRSRLRTAPP